MRLALALALPLSLLSAACQSSAQGQGQNQTQIQDTCQHDETTFRCVQVLKNYDGDTLTVTIPGVHPLLGKSVSVRVAGIDTPELRGKARCEKEAARAARNLVHSLIRGAKNVELRNVARDKYFRILAEVYVDGKSVGQTLLKNRLAYSYDGGTKLHPNWCEVLRMPAAL